MRVRHDGLLETKCMKLSKKEKFVYWAFRVYQWTQLSDSWWDRSNFKQTKQNVLWSMQCFYARIKNHNWQYYQYMIQLFSRREKRQGRTEESKDKKRQAVNARKSEKRSLHRCLEYMEHSTDRSWPYEDRQCPKVERCLYEGPLGGWSVDYSNKCLILDSLQQPAVDIYRTHYYEVYESDWKPSV